MKCSSKLEELRLRSALTITVTCFIHSPLSLAIVSVTFGNRAEHSSFIRPTALIYLFYIHESECILGEAETVFWLLISSFV